MDKFELILYGGLGGNLLSRGSCRFLSSSLESRGGSFGLLKYLGPVLNNFLESSLSKFGLDADGGLWGRESDILEGIFPLNRGRTDKTQHLKIFWNHLM